MSHGLKKVALRRVDLVGPVAGCMVWDMWWFGPSPEHPKGTSRKLKAGVLTIVLTIATLNLGSFPGESSG